MMKASYANTEITHVSEASFKCGAATFCQLLASSRDLGWTALLVDQHAIPSDEAEYETVCTGDQAIAVMTRGEFQLDSYNDGRWRTARYAQGTVGLTPGCKVNRLRRRPTKRAAASEMVKVYIPSGVLSQTVDEYRQPGQQIQAGNLNALSFDDQTITQTVLAILRAVQHGASDLYAETAAQWLATHLDFFHQRGFSLPTRERSPGVLSDRRLARVLEYINSHYGDRLTLDSLAKEAGISKFHFVKLFREATGQTPQAFVSAVRLKQARLLLQTTGMRVSEIAAVCGYQRPTHFASSFSAHYGVSPSRMRAQPVKGVLSFDDEDPAQ